MKKAHWNILIIALLTAALLCGCGTPSALAKAEGGETAGETAKAAVETAAPTPMVKVREVSYDDGASLTLEYNGGGQLTRAVFTLADGRSLVEEREYAERSLSKLTITHPDGEVTAAEDIREGDRGYTAGRVTGTAPDGKSYVIEIPEGGEPVLSVSGITLDGRNREQNAEGETIRELCNSTFSSEVIKHEYENSKLCLSAYIDCTELSLNLYELSENGETSRRYYNGRCGEISVEEYNSTGDVVRVTRYEGYDKSLTYDSEYDDAGTLIRTVESRETESDLLVGARDMDAFKRPVKSTITENGKPTLVFEMEYLTDAEGEFACTVNCYDAEGELLGQLIDHGGYSEVDFGEWYSTSADPEKVRNTYYLIGRG